MKKKLLFGIICVLVVFIELFVVVPIENLAQIDGNFSVDYEDVEVANKNKTFGKFVNIECNSKQLRTNQEDDGSVSVVFKLFGFIPIKKVSARLIDNDEYYVGGVPIGIVVESDGAIVCENKNRASNIKSGDIIKEINNKKISCVDDVVDEMSCADDQIDVTVLRKNKLQEVRVKTQADAQTGTKKLGVLAKDEISGVGTLTFVNKKTNKYGALGHSINESEGNNIVPIAGGSVYQCGMVGIDKGKRNKPGKLNCVLLTNRGKKGDVDSNSKFGVSGVLDDVDQLVDENLCVKMGGRLGVVPGKAKIVSSISGMQEEYEIEIIKANYQRSANDKSLVFRVTDKRLLDMTGGIVQGMSGSPIMQNGKIIGAVTHVFMSDPSKGYGVYIDWML